MWTNHILQHLGYILNSLTPMMISSVLQPHISKATFWALSHIRDLKIPISHSLNKAVSFQVSHALIPIHSSHLDLQNFEFSLFSLAAPFCLHYLPYFDYTLWYIPSNSCLSCTSSLKHFIPPLQTNPNPN